MNSNKEHEYLKTIYDTNSLEEFLELISEDDISNPRTRAIVSTLKRSIRCLNLEFNTVILDYCEVTAQESNSPHQP